MKRTAISAAASVSKKPRVDASVTSPKAEAVEDEQPVASTSTSTTIASSATNAKIEAFKSSLSTSGDPSEAELLKLELDTIEETWLQALLPAIKSSTFLSLKRFLWKEGLRGVDIKQNSIFPPAQDIYSWSRYTPLDRVRVVILGQGAIERQSKLTRLRPVSRRWTGSRPLLLRQARCGGPAFAQEHLQRAQDGLSGIRAT